MSKEDIIKTLENYGKTKYSDNTLLTYSLSISKTLRDPTVKLEDPQSVVDYIITTYTAPTTQKAKSIAMVTYYRALGYDENTIKPLTSYFKSKFDEVEKNAEKNESSESDKGNIPLKNDIDSVIDYYKFKNDLMMLTTMQILKHIPMRNEVVTIKIRNYDEKTDNYIKDGVIYLNQRKNKIKYRYDIPSDAQETLKLWMNENKTDYLLIGKSNQRMTSSGINKKITRVFEKMTGKKVGTSRIRKGFVSEAMDGEKSYAEIKKNADLLGHTVDTHLKHYRKIDYKD